MSLDEEMAAILPIGTEPAPDIWVNDVTAEIPIADGVQQLPQDGESVWVTREVVIAEREKHRDLFRTYFQKEAELEKLVKNQTGSLEEMLGAMVSVSKSGDEAEAKAKLEREKHQDDGVLHCQVSHAVSSHALSLKTLADAQLEEKERQLKNMKSRMNTRKMAVLQKNLKNRLSKQLHTTNIRLKARRFGLKRDRQHIKQLWKKHVKTLIAPMASIIVASNRSKGWSVMRDGYCGKVFYFNHETEESQWEKPKALMTGTELGHSKTWGLASVSIKKALNGFKLLKVKAVLRKQGWVQLVDEESSCTYWHNAKTFSNQWELPDPVESAEIDAAKSADDLSKDLAKEIAEEFHIDLDKVIDFTSVDAEDIPLGSVVRAEWLDYEKQQTRQLEKLIADLDKDIEAAKADSSASSLLQMLDDMMMDDDDDTHQAKGLMEEMEEIDRLSKKHAKTLVGAMEQERQRQLGRLLQRVQSKSKRLGNSKMRHAHVTDLRSIFAFVRTAGHAHKHFNK